MIKLFDNSRFQLAVFLFIFFVALTPVWGLKYFPTVDGPAHLYNARIIRELLFGEADFYSRFFKFNSTPVPNLSGHLIAVFAGLIFPLWMTEKIIVIIITCFIPLSLFYLAKAYQQKLQWHSMLILPFIYTITLYLGFFNFMLGLPVLFFLMGWLKRRNFELSAYGMIGLFMCSIFIYFSHIMVFGLSFFIIIFQMLWLNKTDHQLKLNSIKMGKVFSVFIPGLIFGLLFFSQKSLEGHNNKIERYPFSELCRLLMEGSPLVGISGPDEVAASSLFMIVIAVLFGVIIFSRVKMKMWLLSHDYFLIVSLVMLMSYFVVPDGMASGGFLSLRFLLLFLLFLVLWIIVHPVHRLISVTASLLSVYVSFSTLSFRMEVTKDLNSKAQNMIHIANELETETVLLPLNYSGNWLHTNISNYIGADKNIIVLDNYEAITEAFPLQWRQEVQPFDLAGNFASSLNPYVTIKKYESKTGVRINYATRWQYHLAFHDSVSAKTSKILETHFSGMQLIGEGELFY